MVELQHDRVGFAAIYAGVRTQKSIHMLLISKNQRFLAELCSLNVCASISLVVALLECLLTFPASCMTNI